MARIRVLVGTGVCVADVIGELVITVMTVEVEVSDENRGLYTWLISFSLYRGSGTSLEKH